MAEIKNYWRGLVGKAVRTLFVLTLVAIPLVQLLDRRSPVITHDFAIVNNVVEQGGKLHRRISVTRNKVCFTDVDLLVVDGAGVRWQIEDKPIPYPGPSGEKDTYIREIELPLTIAVGSAELRTRITRICNPMQNLWPLVETFKPLKFTVVPKT